ncbi:MAG TPA: ACT domain-containing protein [Pyrinomonadaceae bacterium]
MTVNSPEKSISELLRETKIEVSPAMFVLVGMSHRDWSRLLEESALSPRAEASFMILRDKKEVTLLLEEDDWKRLRHVVHDARAESEFRLITLDIELPWTVVGFLAEVTSILARADIPLGACSAFSRDHLLIKQEYLGKALQVLGDHVGELC